jgi:hypothetical protein
MSCFTSSLPSTGRATGPGRAELERMVIIESLFMEVISIVIQYPLNPLYPVAKDKFRSKPLNYTQKFLNVSDKILLPGKLLSCQCRVHLSENQNSKCAKSGFYGGWDTRIIEFSAKKFSEAFEWWT